MNILTILMDYMGLTQAELAKRAVISPADLNEMINKEPYADIQKRRRIDPEIMMEIMGHEDFATTVEHYHTTTEEDLDRIFSAVDGISRPK